MCARGRWLLLVWLVLPLACTSGEEATRAGPELPNIVLVISDDHGYPDHGFMGAAPTLTPHIDRLAEEGVVFTHGYSTASVCRPALATLLTGLLPIQLHFQEEAFVEARGGEVADGSFVAHVATLPRLLAARGYTSFQAGKHWEGPFAAAGFDAGMVEAPVREGGNESWKRLVRDDLEPVLDFVERHAEAPFLLWFAPLLPHLPHDAPARFRQGLEGLPPHVARYHAAIRWLDAGVGELVDRIDALGLARRTLVVYLADNGWDPGGEEWGMAPLGGPRGKASLHELGFRTPIVLRWPGHLEAGVRRDELVSFTDVFATLLDYAGAALPPRRDGHSLRPLLEEGAPWPRRDLMGWVNRLRGDAAHGFQRGGSFWRDARWHYLQPVAGAPALYDLASDPQESTDVASEHPEVVERAKQRLEAWTRGLDLAPPDAPER